MIKLIATDMDGTFLDEHKQFDPSFLKIYQEMKSKQIQFVVASGNQYHRLIQKFIPLSEDIYFIADNGSLIAHGYRILYTNTIDLSKAFQIIDAIEKNTSLKVLISAKKSCYAHIKNKQLEPEIRKYYCSYHFVEDYRDIQDDILKIAIYDPQYTINTYCDTIKAMLPPGLRMVTSGNEWIDIQNEGVHKGQGMQYLQSLLHYSKDQCAAFGDQMNDYELLKSVTYSYAMANAVEPIKQLTYQVIGSNKDQAVIKKIKELMEDNYE